MILDQVGKILFIPGNLLALGGLLACGLHILGECLTEPQSLLLRLFQDLGPECDRGANATGHKAAEV